MKMILMMVLVLTLLTGAASAAELEQGIDLSGLEEAAEGYTGDAAINTGTGLNDGLKMILDAGSETVGGVVRKAVRSGVLLLVIVLLCAVAEGAYAGAEKGTVQAVPIVGAVAVTAISVADVNSLIGMGREAIEHMTLFSKALLPTMATVTAAGGAPAGAAARQLATVLFSGILLTLIDRLLMPLVYLYIAACTAYAAVGNEGLRRVSGAVKWVITSVLTTVLLVFVGYLTVSGVIAGSADAVTVKAAKFTMSSMVPVVGGILSDAAETVLAGAGILRNTVGVFGMLAILAMCVTPFLQPGIHYLAYKCTAALAATVSGERVAGLIDGIGGAFGLVLGMTGACALLLLIAMVSSISLVVG